EPVHHRPARRVLAAIGRAVQRISELARRRRDLHRGHRHGRGNALAEAPVDAALDDAISPILTDEPAPPKATWLAAVVVAFVPIAVEPANWAEAKKPKAVAAAPFAELRAPTDIAPSPVASVFEPNTRASLPLAVEL